MKSIKPVIVMGALTGILTAAAAVPSALAAPAVSGGASALAAGQLLPPGQVGSVPADGSDPGYTTLSQPSWAGWIDRAGTNVAIRWVTAKFKIPKVSCGSYGQEEGFWVGLDGVKDSSHTLEQDGVVVACDSEGPNGAEPSYYTFYEMVPYNPVTYGGAEPGDTITASVYYDSGNNDYELTVSDNNHPGADISITRTCPSGYTCQNGSAEVITEDSHDSLADFGTVSFSDIVVTSRDGTRGTLEGSSLWGAEEAIMKTNGGTLKAQPSARTDGYTAFSVAFKNAG